MSPMGLRCPQSRGGEALALQRAVVTDEEHAALTGPAARQRDCEVTQQR
jgi:hypothetical protein